MDEEIAPVCLPEEEESYGSLFKDGPPLTPLAEKCSAQLREVHGKLAKAEERLAEIEEEKAALDAEKDTLEQHTSELRAKLEVLEPICAEQVEEARKRQEDEWSDLSEVGLQECCYRVLMQAREPVSAADICEELVDRGLPMDYANPWAVIHTSLQRIPDRVRSFKEGNTRFYEVIREKKVGAITRPKD